MPVRVRSSDTLARELSLSLPCALAFGVSVDQEVQRAQTDLSGCTLTRRFCQRHSDGALNPRRRGFKGVAGLRAEFLVSKVVMLVPTPHAWLEHEHVPHS